MRFFSLRPFMLLMFLALVSGACAPKKKDSSAAADANFVLLPVTAQDVRLSASQTDLNVPGKSAFTVKACLQDSGLLQPLVDEAFEISGGPQKISRKTDSQGCLYWPESVTFNYLAKESYVRFDRVLAAKGAHQGSTHVLFALDPWKNSNDALFDLRTHPLDTSGAMPSAVIGEHEALTEPVSAHANAIIQEVSLHTYDSQSTTKGTAVTAHITMHPFFSRYALDSTEVRETLKTGHFTLELFLIEKARTGQASDDVLLARERLPVEDTDGVINVVTQLNLARIPNPQSLIELAFRLTPLSINGLAPQESMVVLDQLMTSTTLPIQPLTQALDSYNNPLITDRKDVAQGFRFDSIRIDHGGVLETSASTGAPKRIGIRVTACMKDVLSFRAIIDHPFQVKISDNKKVTTSGFTARVSDTAGCVYWESSMSFDNYAAEQWYTRYLVIRSPKAPYRDIQNNFTVYLNPWETGPLYFWDGRTGPPPSAPVAIPAKARNPGSVKVAPRTGSLARHPLRSRVCGGRSIQSDRSGHARLQITELSYSFTGRDFQVDRFLNLTMKRRYQLRFKPVIFHPVSYSTGMAFDPIRAGHLNLGVLLLADGVPVSLYNGSVDIMDGQAVADVTLPIDIVELPLIISRTKLVVELSDPDSDSSLGSVTVSAPFVAANPDGSIGLRPNQATIQETIANLEPESQGLRSLVSAAKGSGVFRKTTRIAADQLFAAATGYRELKVRDIQLLGFRDSGEVEGFIQGGASDPAKLKLFCRLFGAQAKDCQRDATLFFTVHATDHVEEVMGDPIETQGDAFTVNASASFAVASEISSRDSETSASTHSVYAGAYAKAGVEGGFKVFGTGATASAGVETGYRYSHDWTTAHAVSRGQAMTQGLTISKVRPFLVERATLEVRARVRRCVTLSKVWSENNFGLFLNDGVFFCSGAAAPSQIHESWYYINQQLVQTATLLDPNNRADQIWTKVIRGDRNFESFRQSMDNAATTLVFQKDTSLMRATDKLGDLYRGEAGSSIPPFADGSIPGLLEN